MKDRLLKLLVALCIGLGAPAISWAAHTTNPEKQKLWGYVVMAAYGIYWLAVVLAVLVVFGVAVFVVKMFRRERGASRTTSGLRRGRPLTGVWAWLQAVWVLAFPALAALIFSRPSLRQFFFFYNPAVFAVTYMVGLIFWRCDVRRIREAGTQVGKWRYWGLFFSPVYLLFRAVRVDRKFRYFWLSLGLYVLMFSPFILALC